VEIGDHPAVLLDISKRQFFLFGISYNAQDVWLVFFPVVGLGFSLYVITDIWGRLWCGYACPQTVFLEGLYRRVERLIEGSREPRLRRNRSPLNADKLWRKVLKHLLFAAFSIVLGNVFLSYFIPVKVLMHMMQLTPSENSEAFTWMLSLSGLMYFNFAWFREQTCLIVCPYGRLQSVLTDDNSLVIGYDQRRGEPRGKQVAANNGDCIDCNRCVVVCPTGIDIRNGLQLDCIGCANCVDACDEIMRRIGKPPGLVRYDSNNGLQGHQKQLLRPRLALYLMVGIVGMVLAYGGARRRVSFEANLMRLQREPYAITGGIIRNNMEVHLVNKSGAAQWFVIEPQPTSKSMDFITPLGRIRLESLAGQHIPIFVTVDSEHYKNGMRIEVQVMIDGREGSARLLHAPFVGPTTPVETTAAPPDIRLAQ